MVVTRAWRFSRVLQIGIFVSLFALAVSSRGLHWAEIVVVGVTVTFLSVAILGFASAQLRTGVYEEQGALTVKSAFASDHIPLSELAGFEWRREGLAKVVYARLTTGRLVCLPLVQGQVVVWDGGRTRDIIGV